MPAPAQSNPAGAGGATAGAGKSWDYFYEDFVSAETATTITAGQVVSINTSKQILQATTGVDAKLQVGVAVAPILPGAVGSICTQGVCPVQAVAQGAIAAGALLQRSGTTAGSVASFVPAAATDIGTVVGFAIAAAAGNLVDAYVHKM